MAKQIIRLTESQLNYIVEKTVKKCLNEVSHAYVNNIIQNQRKNGTPEERFDKTTKQFNDLYGSNGQTNIQYDFKPNQQIQKGEQEIFFNNDRHIVSRPSNSVQTSGGVTINGQRYTTGKKGRDYLDYSARDNSLKVYKDNHGKTQTAKYPESAWQTYGHYEDEGDAVFDKDGNIVYQTNDYWKKNKQFTPQELSALNNVNNTITRHKTINNQTITQRNGNRF
jgi:hypothetical protein